MMATAKRGAPSEEPLLDMSFGGALEDFDPPDAFLGFCIRPQYTLSRDQYRNDGATPVRPANYFLELEISRRLA
jgi:hypothetical protein